LTHPPHLAISLRSPEFDSVTLQPVPVISQEKERKKERKKENPANSPLCTQVSKAQQIMKTKRVKMNF
jgi:hypothetical protein